MDEIRIASSKAVSAVMIQDAIDALGRDGGRVTLPEGEIELDRGISLRSNVELVGQGRDTVLRKAPGKVYPLSGYHNYGMCDVPLRFTAGLAPGMTVTIRDDRCGCFHETFAKIVWVEDTWVGIDQGLRADYAAESNPVLVTAFPLIYGINVENVSVRHLTLEGNRGMQPIGIGACRGAALYFLQSSRIAIKDVVEAEFAGEGLGFQMCHHVYIRDCHFARNSGNGFHPGAGSTAVQFENCCAEENEKAGFFFCVRANHVTVRKCRFVNNAGPGISVGTRDSDNLIEDCWVQGNGGAGILFRETRRPVEMHTCLVRNCRIQDNNRTARTGQIVVLGDAHDLAFEHNIIIGKHGDAPGIYAAPTATSIWMSENQVTGCFPEIVVDPSSLALENPVHRCGLEATEPAHFRHLRCSSGSE